MRTLLCGIAALLILAGCGTSRPTTLSAANDSGITVLLVHDGTVVATIAPGFRGKLTDVDGWGYPRTVRLTSLSGIELSDPWDASAGEFNLDMAECGQIFLWMGSPDPSFDLAPSIPASACPARDIHQR
jgi:hypothetical protein